MRELLRRRVPQILGGYLAGSWVLLEFTDWAVRQYSLSPALTNFVAVTLLLLLPGTLVLAWRHGAPGVDRWTNVDGAVIGLNLVAAAGVLFVVFSGQELGAATTVRLLEDDAGNTVERVIPKAEFRRDILVWDFDNESGDPDVDWLEAGLWTGLMQDLSQDLFVTPVDPADPRVMEPLREAGFETPHDIPLALKRTLSESRGVDHFLSGEIVESRGDSIVVRTRLYETRNARVVAERTYRATDPLELVDRMSVDARQDLGIPEWQIEESVDLPAGEMLTDSPEAFRAFSGYRAAQLANRLADARAAADSATKIDPTFAMAYGASGSASLLLGDQAAAREGIAEALQYAYRLPERTRLLLQMVDRLVFRTDPAGALQTANYWAELYPQDPMARQLYAQAYAMQGNTDGMIEQFKALLALDPTNVQAHQAIAAGFRAKEEYDSALVYYDRLAELQPTDVQTQLDIAATHASLIHFDEARAELERARTVAPDDPAVVDQLARLDMTEGRYEDAARRIEEMIDLARTSAERATVAGTEETYYYRLGQYAGLREAYERRLRAISESEPPIRAVQIIPQSETLIYAADWDRTAFAMQQVDSLRAIVEEPWSLTLDVPALMVNLDLGNVAAARENLGGLERLDEVFGNAPARQARIRWAEGRIAELEDGTCTRALPSYREATELAPLASLFRAWYANCLIALGRADEAEGEVERLVQRLPGDPKVRMVAARLYALQGRTEAAIGEVENALATWSEADTDFRPAREAREMLRELQTG
jgi:tetratricopeptide (TPR) repeat protein/TolB-like protein